MEESNPAEQTAGSGSVLSAENDLIIRKMRERLTGLSSTSDASAKPRRRVQKEEIVTVEMSSPLYEGSYTQTVGRTLSLPAVFSSESVPLNNAIAVCVPA